MSEIYNSFDLWYEDQDMDERTDLTRHSAAKAAWKARQPEIDELIKAKVHAEKMWQKYYQEYCKLGGG